MPLRPWQTGKDENDPRAKMLRRFRGYALFWIAILVGYFVGIGILIERTKSSVIDAMPVFVLISACILVASVWHAAAIVVMSLNGMYDKHGPWGR